MNIYIFFEKNMRMDIKYCKIIVLWSWSIRYFVKSRTKLVGWPPQNWAHRPRVDPTGTPGLYCKHSDTFVVLGNEMSLLKCCWVLKWD